MAKDIDELLRDVFGNGRGRTISTQKAETYLQQSKKMNDGLDALEKQQNDLNKRLQNQLDELKKMSGELDFDSIQKEVERDFGISRQDVAAAKGEPVAKELDQRPEAQRFAAVALRSACWTRGFPEKAGDRAQAALYHGLGRARRPEKCHFGTWPSQFRTTYGTGPCSPGNGPCWPFKKWGSTNP